MNRLFLAAACGLFHRNKHTMARALEEFPDLTSWIANELVEKETSKEVLSFIVDRCFTTWSCRRKAARRMLSFKPTTARLTWIFTLFNEDLEYLLMRYSTPYGQISFKEYQHLIDEIKESRELLEEAGKQLIKSQPSHGTIVKILYAVESLRVEAGTILLKTKTPQKVLWFIFDNVEELREQAGRKLIEMRIEFSRLSKLALNYPSLRELAWNKILSLDMRAFHLHRILEADDQLRERAWVKYLNCKPDKEDLSYVLQKIPSLSVRAGKEILKLKRPLPADLNFMIERVPELCEQAKQRLKK